MLEYAQRLGDLLSSWRLGRPRSIRLDVRGVTQAFEGGKVKKPQNFGENRELYYRNVKPSRSATEVKWSSAEAKTAPLRPKNLEGGNTL